jgi:O-acetyl-ADP-ribose deacetylase (regulator of RNase III)
MAAIIVIKHKNILRVRNVDVLVLPGTIVGTIGDELRQAAGDDFEKEVRDHRNMSNVEGSCQLLSPGDLRKQKIKGVVIAALARYAGSPTSYAILEKCLKESFKIIRAAGFTSVAIPDFSKGFPYLAPEVVAEQVIDVAWHHGYGMSVSILDLNDRFLDAARASLSARQSVNTLSVSAREK